MSDLILDSLEIKNFRLFEHLEIERLGRVNLIVGKNGVGKTALLEALWLYAKGTKATFCQHELLIQRDERGLERARSRAESDEEDALLSQRHLFPNRPEGLVREDELVYSSNSEKEMISIGPRGKPEKSLCLKLVADDRMRAYKRWEADLGEDLKRDNNGMVANVFRVFAGGLEEEQISVIWKKIELTNLEDQVLKILRLISYESELEGVRLLTYPTDREGHQRRIPIARLANQPEPVPLRSLGEGVNRLLGIALALVNAKGGILLIDEIESGLHYSVQPDMWRLVFETAAKLNVQVFATTHSWDCIEAFQEAAEAYPEEGVLISLRRKQQEEGIAAVLFDEKDLESVTRSYIEVR